MYDGELHAKRVESLADAVDGAMRAAAVSVSAIGRALADARGLKPRHAVKQVDRLLSNDGFDLNAWFPKWITYLLTERREIVVALDWTDFDKDGHATLALNLLTSHGRATPMMWVTVEKSRLKGWRNTHEDRLLERFRAALPADARVTVLADRGFGDSALYALLLELGFNFVIRFRDDVTVSDAVGDKRKAREWVPATGRAKHLVGATVTEAEQPVPAVVCVKAKGMRSPWCLAVGDCDMKPAEAVKLYGKRFTIEESFRDVKNPRLGFGMSQARVSTPQRRDRLWLIAAVALTLLTLLGAASERCGMDRDLRVNTVKTRTHSLLFQGTYYFSAIPNMKHDNLVRLMRAYDEVLREHAALRDLLGVV